MNKRKLIILAVIVVIVGGGLWWGPGANSTVSSADIVTSGFIEATDTAISLEMNGRIVEIAAGEGDSVKAGALLVRLDDSLLKAQEKQAETNVALARARLQQALVAQDRAKLVWETALEKQRNPLEKDTQIIAAQNEVELAELNRMRVNEIDKEWRLSTAQVRVDTAKKMLDNLLSYEALGLVAKYYTNKEVLPAEGELAQAKLALNYQKQLITYVDIPAAELRYASASKTLASLMWNNKNAVEQTNAAYQEAVAAAEAAKKQLEPAEAALEVISVHLSKLTAIAPVSGVVAARHAEVGEIAQPGAPILTITQLADVTLTAYVPESKIGLVKLGQKALSSVDSYPGETFSGTISYISPRALFTPKNVQLKEEREKMVFAVKISLANPGQKLKPGMPADTRIVVTPAGK